MKKFLAAYLRCAAKFFILHFSFLIPNLSLPLLHPDHRQLYAFPFGIYAEYLYAYLLVDGHNLIRV